MTISIRCPLRRLLGTTLIAIGILFHAPQQADAQIDVSLPTMQLDGSRSENLGRYRLAESFRFAADIRIDASQRWKHWIELGGVEHGMNAPLRIETGNPGEWYVAMGDGQRFEAVEGQGSWVPGSTVRVVYEFSGGVGRLYENDQLIAELHSTLDVLSPEGTLIMGSYAGRERFAQGEIRPEPLRLGLVPVVDYYVPEIRLDGATSRMEGGFVLPPVFTIIADVTVDRSDQWRHLLEIGTMQHSWNAALRLESGNAGEWYVAVGDGSQSAEVTGQGSWQPGSRVTVAVTYDNGHGRLFENDRQIAEFHGPANLQGGAGRLIVGGMQGKQRFFEGTLHTARLIQGIHYEAAPEDGIAAGGAIALWNDSQKRYLVAEDNGELNANRESIGDYETFGAVPANGGSTIRFQQDVGLISHHGRWLAGQDNGQAWANRCTRGDWETWQFVNAKNPNSTDVVRCWDTVALRTTRGQFLVAQDDGSAWANRSGVGPWETFLIDCQPGSKPVPQAKDLNQCLSGYQPDGCSAPTEAEVFGVQIDFAMTEKYNGKFHDACNEHDSCYARPGGNKQACDDNFQTNMNNVCGGLGGLEGSVECPAVAEAYYKVVSLHSQGQKSWDQARGVLCDCGLISEP